MGRWQAGALVLVALGMGVLSPADAGASGAAATFTVTGFSDGTGSCASTPDTNGNVACTTLRAAVSQANLQASSPSSIYLQAGTYQLTQSAPNELKITAPVTLTGAGPGGTGGTTIQQTDGVDRVIEVDAPGWAVTLSDLEITGGHLVAATGAQAQGGGILGESKLTLENVRVTGNVAQGGAGSTPGGNGGPAIGGGIAMPSGAAGSAIVGSTVDNNTAEGGPGGAYPTGQSGNGGYGYGGGIDYESTGSLDIADSTITSNTAAGASSGFTQSGTAGAPGTGGGGGVFAYANVVIARSTLNGNTASSAALGVGGGLYDLEAVATVVDSTVFGNVAQATAPAASGKGGGIEADGSQAGLQLASDTVVGNTASTDAGDLEAYVGNPPNPYLFAIADTIIAQGSAPSGTDCDLHRSTDPPSSESYNLEDDAADTCGFTASNHDLVGASPQVTSAPTDNGGPTQTLAPATTSPVLRAGGQCLDPASTPPGQPLALDQRGLPRPNPCDIGSFQSQAPRNTVRPAVYGVATRGFTLICNPGSWSGDGPLDLTFTWLRNGVPVPGAAGNSYLVGKADPGQSLVCRVTASHYGSVAASSSLVSVTPYPRLTLLRVRVSRGAVVVDLGCRGVDGQRCSGRMQLSLVERLHGSTVIAVAASRRTLVGQHPYSLLARHTATVTIPLKGSGSRLLKRFKTLPAMLTVTQTTGAGTATVASRKLKLRLFPTGRRKR